MRIFVLYSARRSPGGGHKQMRLLVRNLQQLGQDAWLLRESQDVDDNVFYGIDVPVAPFPLDSADRHLAADDILLLPEFRLPDFLALSRNCRCRRGVYAQGGFLALLYRPPGGYGRCGIEFMIGVSPYIAVLSWPYLGLPRARAFHVPYAVVRGPFAEPLPPFESKRTLVSYMPRKLPEHIRQVRGLVARHHPDVPWVAIDGVHESEVARRLTESALFFSTQNGEGFGLPAVEAMARGCVVAGYPGTGMFPHPYATRENGFWARDRDAASAARQLCQAILAVRDPGGVLVRVRAAARETANRFSEGAALDALRCVLEAVEKRRYVPDGHRFRLGWRGHLQALTALLRSFPIRRKMAGPRAAQSERRPNRVTKGRPAA